MIESQEQERKRVAAELHDSLSQSLVIIKTARSSASTARRPESHQRAIGRDRRSPTHAIDEVKEIAYALRPFHWIGWDWRRPSR